MRRVASIVLVVAVSAMWLTPSAVATPTARKSYMVVLRNDVANASFVESKGRTLSFGAQRVFTHALNGFQAKLTAGQVAALRADPRVLFVSKERYLRLTDVQSELPVQPAQVPTFGIRRIGGTVSSTASGDGTGTVDVNVAVVDCRGRCSSRPEPRGRDRLRPRGPKLRSTPSITGRWWLGSSAHSTTTSAVSVSPPEPGSGRQESSTGFDDIPDSNLVCALDWVLSTRTDTDPTNDIAVVNMSLGGFGKDDHNCGLTDGNPVHVAVCNVVAAGVTVVASAGNASKDFQKTYPANFQEVLTATAMADNDGVPGGLGGNLSCLKKAADDTRAFFSNWATLDEDKAHTVAAPGVCVGSLYPGGLYATDSGTSYAAPYVSGMVALCIASGPCAGLTPQQIVEKIVADATAYNIADPSYGFGGDPAHPIPNQNKKYFGYLIRVAQY